MEYDNLTNLYRFLIPVFNVKKRILKYENYDILEKDIWQYLTIHKWQKANDLTISDMVNDIINVNPLDIINNHEGEKQ